jgi:cytidylate kinase
MSGNLIITIGRECGSGGRMIGMKLAERLGIKAYDKELLLLAAQESGLSKEILEHHDEKPTNSFLYSLVTDNFSSGYAATGYFDMPLNQKAFLAQFDTIKKLADQESCVMIGRCADYALADYPNVVRVFICGEFEDRLKSAQESYDVPENKVKDFVNKTDKKRASYYNYYTNQKWGNAASYDLCINSSAVGYEGAVDTILNFIETKRKYQNAK